MYHFDALYKVNNGDDLGSATFWNQRFQDLDLRINATESWSAKIDQAVSDVEAAGLNRLNATFTPYVDGLIAQVNTLTQEVTDLENLVLTDQDSVVNQLNDLLAQAQAVVNNINTLGTVSGGTF